MMNRSLVQEEQNRNRTHTDSVVRETIAPQKKRSALYYSEKIVTRTAVDIASGRTQTSG
jgi:hypothetical protein